MIDGVQGDTRTRLLEAAAGLVASAPGEDFSLRAVCDAVGVRLPTLYHFFGSKQGLIDAIVEHGFDLYLAAKSSTESSGDPIQDLRGGWDAHVAFGVANPGLYALMYGTVRPGYSPPAQSRPTEVLLSLTRRAQELGRLAVPHERAAAHILATNVGVTLRQIILAEEDRALSVAAREGVIASITGTTGDPECADVFTKNEIEFASAHPEILGAAETRLLIQWLRALRVHRGDA